MQVTNKKAPRARGFLGSYLNSSKLSHLFIIAHAAAEIAGLGDKANLSNRRCFAGFRKTVADLVNLPVLRRFVEFFAKGLAGRILQRPHILPAHRWGTRHFDAVRKLEAERIEIAVFETALAVVEH